MNSHNKLLPSKTSNVLPGGFIPTNAFSEPVSLVPALFAQALDALPLGVALLDGETGQTLWNNRALADLLRAATGATNIRGWLTTEYLPGLSEDEWERVWSQRDLSASSAPTAPRRVTFVEQATRNIAYWEWSLQTVSPPSGDASDNRAYAGENGQTPQRAEEYTAPASLVMLSVQAVSDRVLNERLLAAAGRTADRARRRAEALARLTELVNAAQTTPQLLQAITEEAAAYFDAQHAAVWLLSDDKKYFRVGYSIGLQSNADDGIAPLLWHETLAAHAIAARKTLALSHPASDLRLPTLAGGLPVSALVCSPITQGEQVYGAVEIYFSELRAIPDEAQALLTTFAEQTALGLLRAALYDQIAEQRQQLQTIFDNAPVAIVYFNTAGVALNANAAASTYGTPDGQVVGRCFSELWCEFPPTLFSSVAAGMPYHANHYAFESPRTGIGFTVDLSLLPIRDDKGSVTGVLLLAFDVSELIAARQQAEDALAEVRATQSQMLQMEKMRAVGELASGVAHDFNNALMAILGYTELAADDLDDPEALTAHLAIIKQAAQDATTTVQRLQRFARQQTALGGEPTDVNVIVRDAYALTRPRWRDAAQREGRAYDVKLALQDVPLINGEASGLREVLLNLIYNALNAMPDGGTLTLTTRTTQTETENWVEIEVNDTGQGMTPDVQQRIFDPFFTTRGVEGTGLGLAVSWSIVQRHGGTIGVASEPGVGSRFVLRFPAGISTPVQAIPKPLPAPPLPLPSGVSILVVDDEPAISQALTRLLTRRGFHVAATNSSQDALVRVTADPALQLVLTDHGMPGMTGLQLTHAVKQIRPHLPVLLLTGWGESVLQTNVADPPPDAVLGKPINQTDLLAAISRVLHEPSAEQPALAGKLTDQDTLLQ